MRGPRLLLTWSERWRATALAVPAVRPPAGDGFDADLAALRQATSRLEEARRQGAPTASLEREQQRLEKAVRATSLRTRGSAVPARRVIDIGEMLDQLGAAQLIEIVDINGTLQVLLCGAGRVRQLTAGNTADAVRAADFARFALRRLARGRPGDDPDSAAAILKAVGPQLQDAVLGPAVGLLRDGPLVVVPPGRLHGIPWALLPALASRAFSVAPSAGAWLRAHAARPPDRQHVVLARGPGLVTNGAEVPLVAELYDDVTVLSGAEATAAKCYPRSTAPGSRTSPPMAVPRRQPDVLLVAAVRRAADGLRLRAATSRTVPAGAVLPATPACWRQQEPMSCSGWSAVCCHSVLPGSRQLSFR